jgi:molybdate transport system ATP-binding protein
LPRGVAPIRELARACKGLMMSTASIPLVSLKALDLSGRNDALDGGFDWALYREEQWAITGPTASGKSLLARAIAGMGPLSSTGVWSAELGERRSQVPSYVTYVAFDGRPPGQATFHQARWHAQALEDSTTVDASLSVESIRRRNPYEVRDDPHLEDVTAFQARRARVIADLDLIPLLNRRLHHLSDGEWRRVCIGRALLNEPRLLVLDDPFTGLDKDFRARLQEVLTRLMKTGTQLLLVIPDLADLPLGITHVLALDGHARVVSGRRADVLRKLAMTPLLPPAAHSVGAGQATTQVDKAPANKTGPAVKMRAVSVIHGGTTVLQDVSWVVRRGERWALVGPNGAGKSTLLSLILGDHPQAYANQIELFGRQRGSGESIWEIKRRIGWVSPELHRYFPVEVTTADLVASGFLDTLGLRRACTAEQQAQVRRWMARFELSDCAERPFRTLSKGEQRLALIARALVKSPELLILDEPCQGLDAAHIDRVLHVLGELMTPRELRHDGVHTMIYVTHRPEEFPAHLTHVLELEQGRVVRQAALASPASP